MVGSEPVQDWRYALARAWQVAAGEVLSAEPDLFLAAIDTVARCVDTLPATEPLSALWDSVALPALCAAMTFHGRYHRLVDDRACSFSPRPPDLPAARAASAHLLHTWGAAYLTSFVECHDMPVALRAAAWLRRNYRERCVLELICAHVSASRAALLRGFDAVYRTSPLDFAARLRLRDAAVALRDGLRSGESIAAAVGYGDFKGLRLALRRRAGVEAREIGRMSEAEFEAFCDDRLRVPRAFEAVRYLAAPAAAPATSFSTCPSRM